MAMDVRVRWQGNRLWTAQGRRHASQGLTNAVEHLLGEARRLVPIEEGTLERSGKTSVDELDAAVSFDTVYAVRQHEELTWRHAPGRRAKYLETPLTTERDVMLRLMAVPLRRWTAT